MTRSIYLGPKKNPRLAPWVFCYEARRIDLLLTETPEHFNPIVTRIQGRTGCYPVVALAANTDASDVGIVENIVDKRRNLPLTVMTTPGQARVVTFPLGDEVKLRP